MARRSGIPQERLHQWVTCRYWRKAYQRELNGIFMFLTIRIFTLTFADRLTPARALESNSVT
ncbi:uncharacterized protein FPRO_03062 [Fusarium proliferatum ET1]|uniref:Uncharacterized protein n=1 Tax=Fusarium proliferatum (strain ET1) TaxID=1227346 RepID=A0A1L7V776_FUSPR|nr:uncharacterized protein FPRO_03062 [Fusarium proliferatum ET1]CZR36678.1 uncharacterized protein FPRO_03062 [Fusarium proliferatum ET1]